MNQERIIYRTNSGKIVKSELVTYVTKVDDLLKVYGKEKSNGLDLSIPIREPVGELNLSKQEELIQLAETLDQINSQNYPILFTIFLGLNANPSNSENRQAFWKSLDSLIKETYDTRKKQIEIYREID